MPTLNQIKNRVNTQLNNLWSTIQTRQDIYFQKNNAYWQGLVIPSQIPEFSDVDDNPRDADGTDKVAKGHDVSWDEMLPEIKNTSLSAQIRVITYETPLGHGYLVNVMLRYKGKLFSRTKQYGPETQEDKNWHEIFP